MGGRVTFLVDGFNLYHSVRRAMRDTGERHLRWLDLTSLLRSYLYVFGTGADLEAVHYFTAYAHHLSGSNPGVVSRHRTFVEALEGTGVRVHVARFKKKSIRCPACRTRFKRHEEKETDVAIGVTAMELLHNDRCDTLAGGRRGDLGGSLAVSHVVGAAGLLAMLYTGQDRVFEAVLVAVPVLQLGLSVLVERATADGRG